MFFIDQETSDEINKKVLDVLRTCSHEGWQWYDNKDDEEWAKLDDDMVSSVTQAEVLDLNGGGDWHMAYINIYRRKELIPK